MLEVYRTAFTIFLLVYSLPQKHHLSFPILRDPEGKTLRKYGRDQIPLIVLLDKQGQVYGKPLEGFGPAGYLDRTLGSRLFRLTH